MISFDLSFEFKNSATWTDRETADMQNREYAKPRICKIVVIDSFDEGVLL